MEPKPPKVESRPPALIDRAVRFLIPPASREAVVGDLWERYSSPFRYVAEALRILPYLIASQIRRNSNIPMLGIAAFTLFVGFGGIFRPDTAPSDAPRWARAAIAVIAALIGLLLRDAYRGNEPRAARRAAFDVVTVIACVLMSQAILAGLRLTAGLSPDWLLPLTPRRALMTVLGLAMLFCLRLAADYRLPGAAGEISADDLAGEFQRFERGVRWRNRAMIIGGLVAVIPAPNFVLRASGLSQQIGYALSIVLGLFIVWYIANKTSVEPMPRAASFTSSLAFYRQELNRQRKLLRKFAWWYLLSLFPAIAGLMIGRGVTNSQPLMSAMGGYLLICFFVGWLYVQGARRLQNRIDNLAGLEPRQ